MTSYEPDGGRAPPSTWTPWLTGLVLLAALGAWWVMRSTEGAAVDAALTDYAAAPLPAVGGPVDAALADLGAEVFRARCAACHTLTDEPALGPQLRGVTQRRGYAWLVAMMMEPDSMTSNDPDARTLKEEYGVQMLVPGGVERVEARAVLEFLRRMDAGAP